jgi:zinc protease
MRGAAALALLLAACGGASATSAGRFDLPAYSPYGRDDGGRARREQPPPATEVKPAPFPTVETRTLANGAELAVVRAPLLPLVQIRILVRAGQGYAPKQPGAAELTARLLKDGGTRSMTSAELLRRIEGLGADISVEVGLDATTITTALGKEHFAEALGIVGEMVQAPRFDGRELDKLKARASDEADDHLRGSGQYSAMHAMFGALYQSAQSPYAHYGLVPSEIAKINLGAVKDFHRRHYTPKNTTIVIVGDVTLAEASARAEKVFGAWSGDAPPKLDFPPPALEKRRVILTSRPRSAQSDVFVVDFAPPRTDPGWPAVRICNQVLGGGVAGRLFLDVREHRSLAYSASSRIVELAHGEQPVVAYAGTRTEKTADAVNGILDNIQAIARPTGAPTQGETEAARRYLSDVFAVRMETIGAVADMVAELATLALPYDYWDKYRDALRGTERASVIAQAARVFHPETALIVVAGDADAIGSTLTRFGEVTIVDPEHDFAVTKTLKPSL